MSFQIRSFRFLIGERCGQPGHRLTAFLYQWTKGDPCEQSVYLYLFGWRFGIQRDPFYFLGH